MLMKVRDLRLSKVSNIKPELVRRLYHTTKFWKVGNGTFFYLFAHLQVGRQIKYKIQKPVANATHSPQILTVDIVGKLGLKSWK